jgi:hypothetical protein
MLVAILIVGIIGREFFNAFYVVRELLVVVSFAALAVFFIAGLVVLAIVSHSVWQGLGGHVTGSITGVRTRRGGTIIPDRIARKAVLS